VIEEIATGVERDMRGDPLQLGDRVTWTERNRHRFPLAELGSAFKKAAERSVLRAAIVP
jgi:hypothetical protein